MDEVKPTNVRTFSPCVLSKILKNSKEIMSQTLKRCSLAIDSFVFGWCWNAFQELDRLNKSASIFSVPTGFDKTSSGLSKLLWPRDEGSLDGTRWLATLAIEASEKGFQVHKILTSWERNLQPIIFCRKKKKLKVQTFSLNRRRGLT